jgi:mannose-6-phosphate isomerase-like protein (cupin superfamily)
MIYTPNDLLGNKPRLFVATGGYDPLHPGHIEFFKQFKQFKRLGNSYDTCVVGLNSDEWLIRKKGFAFFDASARATMLGAIGIDVIRHMKADAPDSCAFLTELKDVHKDYEIVFCKGGDRTVDNIPEMSVQGISFCFGVGGGPESKKYSSSVLVQKFTNETLAVERHIIQRPWGYYETLYSGMSLDGGEIKVKRLVVEPGKSLSIQKHRYREEHWFVVTGHGILVEGTSLPSTMLMNRQLYPGASVTVGKGYWHQLSNQDPTKLLKIIEVQVGEKCDESDIERADTWN